MESDMKRWPVIRHVRFFWLNWLARRWAREWGRAGVGLGYPNASDEDFLRMVWEGKA